MKLIILIKNIPDWIIHNTVLHFSTFSKNKQFPPTIKKVSFKKMATLISFLGVIFPC